MAAKVSIFTKHPEDVGMTYFEHFKFAMSLAKLTFTAFFASVVHAFFPFLFVTTTSRITMTLYNKLKFRLPENKSMKSMDPDESINFPFGNTFK